MYELDISIIYAQGNLTFWRGHLKVFRHFPEHLRNSGTSNLQVLGEHDYVQKNLGGPKFGETHHILFLQVLPGPVVWAVFWPMCSLVMTKMRCVSERARREAFGG